MWALLFLVLSASHGTATPIPKYSLLKAGDDLSVLLRIVNSMAIAQELENGNIKERDVAGELVGLKESVLEELETNEIPDLGNDFSEISSAAEKVCSGGDICGDLVPLKKGIEAVEKIGSMDFSPLENALKDGSPAQTLMALVKFITRMNSNSAEWLQRIRKFFTDLPNVKSSETIKTFRLIGDLEDVVTLLNSTRTVLTTKKIEMLQKDKLLSAFNDIINTKSFVAQIQNDTKLITAMESSLGILIRKRKNVELVISKEKLKSLKKKLDIVTRIDKSADLSFNERKYTSGLLYGHADLGKLMSDVASKIVKSVMANGTNVEELEKMLAIVIQVGKKIEPFVKSFDGKDIRNEISTLKISINLAEDEVEIWKLFAPLLECVKQKKIDTVLDFSVWEKQITELNKLKSPNALYNFAQKVQQLSNMPTTELTQFLNFMKKDKNTKTIQSYPNLPKVETEFGALEKVMTGFVPNDVSVWSRISFFDKHFLAMKQFLEKVKLPSTTSCLKANNFLPSGNQKFLKSNDLSALKPLKYGNPEMKEIANFAFSFNDPIDGLKFFERNVEKLERRSADRNVKLGNPFDVVKQLSGGVKVIVDLSKAKAAEKEIKDLLASAKKIDEEVGKLKDPAAKSEIQKVWNNDTKTTLKAILANIEAADKAIKDAPRQITDYSRIFVYSKDIKMDNFNGEKLSQALSVVQNQSGIQKLLPKISTLNLEFANAQQRLDEAEKSLKPLEEFMDEYFGIERPMSEEEVVEANKIAYQPEQGSLGFFLFLCFLYFLYGSYLMRKWISLKREERDLEEGATPGADGTVENGPQGSVAGQSKVSVASASKESVADKSKETVIKDKKAVLAKRSPQQRTSRSVASGDGRRNENPNGEKEKGPTHSSRKLGKNKYKMAKKTSRLDAGRLQEMEILKDLNMTDSKDGAVGLGRCGGIRAKKKLEDHF